MSDQGPLSIAIDTTQIKTGRPIIHDGAQVRVRFMNLTEVLGDKGKMLLLEVHLLDPTTDTEGKEIRPGFSIRDRVTLYDKNTPPGQIPDRALERISQIQDAFLGTGDPGNRANRPARPVLDTACIASMVGREAYIKVKAKTGEYQGNDIVKYINPEDLKA